MKQLAIALTIAACIAVGLLGTATTTDAASLRTLPGITLKTLDEKEVRLTDAKFEKKIVLVSAFTTWNEASRQQARALEAFHKAHPEVEIVGLIVDELAAARDFVASEGLTFPVYKSNDGPRVATNFVRLFEAKKAKTISVNRVPFVILADKDRKVVHAQFGLADLATLNEKLATIK